MTCASKLRVKRPRGAAYGTPAVTVRRLLSSRRGTGAVLMVCFAVLTPAGQADGRLSPCGWFKLAGIQMPPGAFLPVLDFRPLVGVRISPETSHGHIPHGCVPAGLSRRSSPQLPSKGPSIPWIARKIPSGAIPSFPNHNQDRQRSIHPLIPVAPYRITLEVSVPVKNGLSAHDGKLVMSLQEGEAVSIVPAGNE